MTDLFITAMTPRLGSGTGLRTYGVVAALARLGPVEVSYVEFGGAEPAPEYGALPGVTLSGMPASRGGRRAAAFVRALARQVPFDFARGVSNELVRAAGDAPASTRIIADGPVVAAALLEVARRRPVVYLAHNLESAGFRGPSGHLARRRFERGVLDRFAESWMATRADEHGARQLGGPSLRTRYVPNVIDAAAIAPVRPAGARRLLFVANFAYPPNLEALEFLVEEVMPAVWHREPRARLLAVGRGLAERERDPRIETPGFVADLRDAYADSDVIVVPLLRGGGSPLKFIEGLAYGLPVVASSHAAALLEDGQAGQDFIIASGAEAFAGAVTSVLADPGRAARLGSCGRELALRRYSVETLSAELSA